MNLQIDLNKIQIFKVLALCGSFTAAAKQLNMPKSKVSRSISSLEKQIGSMLIYRSTRSFELTSAGKLLFQRGVPALDDIQILLEHLTESKEKPSGTIRFTVPEDIAIEHMSQLIHEFQLIYPMIKIDLIVENRVVNLVSEGVDIALRIGKNSDSTLMAKSIGKVSLHFYASEKLFNQFVKPQQIERIIHLPYLSFKNQDKSSLMLISQQKKINLKLDPIFYCNNFFVIKQRIIQGDGIGLLPRHLVNNELAEGLIIPFLNSWKTPASDVKLVYLNQKDISKKLRIFIDFITPKLKILFNDEH